MNAYKQLLEIHERIHNFQHLGAIAYWDQEAMMPQGSNDARSKALAQLDVLVHEESTSSKINDLIEESQSLSLTQQEQTSLFEIKRNYDLKTVLPTSLVKAKSLAGSKCGHAWREQRKNNDWKGFLPNLEEVIKLSKEEASIRASHTGLSAYDSLLNMYEPGMKSESLDNIFSEVKTWLPSLIQDVVEKQKTESFINPIGPFPTHIQKELGLKVMKHLGFDFSRGRIDISSHPFCGGVPEDVRITTRYDENDFVQSLMGTVHETGHARYEQNLPLEFVSLPVGNARSMGIHESQSLFFEMQMGRGRAFLESIHSHIQDAFGDSETFSIENLCKIYNHVKPDFIRVDADEVTYAAHVMLRYEIEKELINGNLEARDIPEVWDEKMLSYLGVNTKGNYKNGVMQDVHWTEGLIGYFPSYTLGAMYAAQQFNTVQKQHPDVNENISKGDFTQVFSWLDENIWKNASFYSTDVLMKNATGEILNPKYFKEHLENRYLK